MRIRQSCYQTHCLKNVLIQANSNATNANSNLISTTVPGSLTGKLNTIGEVVSNFPAKLPGTVVEIKLELALVALELAWIRRSISLA